MAFQPLDDVAHAQLGRIIQVHVAFAGNPFEDFNVQAVAHLTQDLTAAQLDFVL